MQNNPEKTQADEAKEAFEIFSNQFGPDDIYKSILLEVLLEELLKKDELCQAQKPKSGSI